VIEGRHPCVAICPELLCVGDEPVKLWDVKVEVHEKYDVEVVKKRGIDLGQKVLQILINAFERKVGESRGDKACGRRQRSAFWIGARSRGTESKIKGFKAGHHCQSSGHRVG